MLHIYKFYNGQEFFFIYILIIFREIIYETKVVLVAVTHVYSPHL